MSRIKRLKIKKVFALMIFIFLSITITNAQIDKPKSINNKKLPSKSFSKVLVKPQRIQVTDLNKLQPKEVANLKAATVNREALTKLRFSKHWEITPAKLKYKDMYVESYFGKFEARPRYISIYPENKYYPRLDRGQPGFLPEIRYLTLKFYPETGKRYRMLIKLKPGNYRNKKIATQTAGARYTDLWYVNDQYDEVMFDFIAESQTIKISNIIAGTERYYVLYEPLEIEKITIDKVEE